MGDEAAEFLHPLDHQQPRIEAVEAEEFLGDQPVGGLHDAGLGVRDGLSGLAEEGDRAVRLAAERMPARRGRLDLAATVDEVGCGLVVPATVSDTPSTVIEPLCTT